MILSINKEMVELQRQMLTQGIVNMSLCKRKEPQAQAGGTPRLGLGCLLIQVGFMPHTQEDGEHRRCLLQEMEHWECMAGRRESPSTLSQPGSQEAAR